MKRTTRIISVLLAVLMLFSSAVTAFADDGTDQPVLPAPEDNKIDTSVYVKTVLESPKVKQANADKLLYAVRTFTDMDAVLADKLTQDVLTGQSVVLMLDGIVDAIAESLDSDNPTLAALAGSIKFLFSNSFLISGLQQDDRFAGAVEKFQKASDDGFSTIPDIIDAGIEFTSADFGFEDGNAYGFLDALVCSLSEILTQLNVRSILGDFTDSVKDGAYVTGNYELFVPLYELLELNPYSSAEFTKLVELAESNSKNDAKTRFRTAANLTLTPVADLLTKIEHDGFEAVIDLLPRVLYALDSGMFNDLVRNLLRDKNLYGLFQFNDVLEKLDLNTGLLYDVIDKNLITGTEEKPAGFDFDKDGKKETTLPLTREQFDAIVKKLTFAADPVVKPSVSAKQKNRLALDTDDTLVTAILFNAVVELLETAEGAAFAERAIGGLEKKTEKRLAGALLKMLQSKAGRFVLYHTQSLLADTAGLAAIIYTLRNKRTPSAA